MGFPFPFIIDSVLIVTGYQNGPVVVCRMPES